MNSPQASRDATARLQLKRPLSCRTRAVQAPDQLLSECCPTFREPATKPAHLLRSACSGELRDDAVVGVDDLAARLAGKRPIVMSGDALVDGYIVGERPRLPR